jgi:hypothetical protein
MRPPETTPCASAVRRPGARPIGQLALEQRQHDREAAASARLALDFECAFVRACDLACERKSEAEAAAIGVARASGESLEQMR